MRELSYSAIRMGLYDEVKELLAGEAGQLQLCSKCSLCRPRNRPCSTVQHSVCLRTCAVLQQMLVSAAAEAASAERAAAALQLVC